MTTRIVIPVDRIYFDALRARVKKLEEANAALEDMVSRYAIQMSDMLTRLNERYPEDFVWLKEPDQ